MGANLTTVNQVCTLISLSSITGIPTVGISSMAERLLTIEETSGITRQSVATLRYWRHRGTGPPSARIGRRVMYRESDVLAWLDKAFKDEARLSRVRLAGTVTRSA